ncbi:MAG: copper amine oxidase N-terminal domain-containing protein [Dethiobacter sp.]|nr:copper amine oxidase N-terminal domain-containing protein [Dethiobacter sp.]
MFKTNRKKISILLVLAMVMTMLAGLAAPAGATTPSVNVRGVSVNVAPVTPATLGLVELTNAAERVVAGGSSLEVEVRLPAGFTFRTDPAPALGSVRLNGAVPAAAALSAGPTLEAIDTVDNRLVRFTVAPPDADINNLRFLMGRINIPTAHRGAINAEVRLRSFVPGVGGQEVTQEVTMWEQTATVQVGNVLAAGTASAAVTKPTIQRGVAAQAAGNITITENVVGSIPVAATITLTAPAGVLFAAAPTVGETGGLVAAPDVLQVYPRRDVVINVTTASTIARSVITVSGIRFNVEPQVADGDVGVTIVGSANSNVTPATVANAAVGAVAVGQVTVDADPATPAADRVVTAGRLDAAIASIRLRETTAGAIQPGRVVSFTLPVGFTWDAAPAPAPAIDNADPGFTAPSATSDAGRTVSFWTSGVSTAPVTRVFGGLLINASATAPAGDITVTVGGTAGVSGTVVVGRARTPYTVTAVTAPNLRADQRGQLLGNLVVTENFAGAFRGVAGNLLTVTLPVGVTLSAGVTPTVVASGGPGTMAAGTVNVPEGRRSFTVETAATASMAVTTWTISGLRVDLDRVPVGPITVTAGGTALIAPVADAAALGIAGVGVTTVDAARALVGTTVASVNLGNVVSATATRSVFTIGALSFLRDGVSTPIDAAPVVVDGRTLLPLRFAALAVGVSGESIIWDAARQTVTMLRGDRVVQLQIGSRNMLINGVPIPMDVAPSIVSGRTVLPIAWLALALRADVAWDATARTVTVTTN